MCANVCNFGLSNFEKNGPLQLFLLCNFMLEVAVDSVSSLLDLCNLNPIHFSKSG